MEMDANGLPPGSEGQAGVDAETVRTPLIAIGEEAFAKQVRSWLRESAAAKKDKLDRRKRDHRIHGGEQWEEGDAQLAKKLRRPALTMNLMLSLIAAIEGEERENRKSIKFFGNDNSDEDPATGLNRILKWIEKGCGGEFEMSRALRNTAISGEDWLGIEVDYFEDPEGRVLIVQVDDEEIFDDPQDTSPTAKKGRFLIRVKMWAEDEIDAKWPGAVSELIAANFGGDGGREEDRSGYRDIYEAPDDRGSLKLYDSKEKRWAIIECWWQQVLPGHVVVNDQTGLLEEKSDEEYEQLVEERRQQQMEAFSARLAAVQQPPLMSSLMAQTAISGVPTPTPLPEIPPAIQAIRRPIKRFFQSFLCVDKVLERQESPVPGLKRFPYVPVRAYFKKDTKEYFGFIRPAIDPQLQFNVEQSVLTQLTQLMPKSSWMAPKGAFHNKADWMEKLAQPGSLLEYNATRGKPEPIQPPTISRHFAEQAMVRPQQVRDIAGVPVEMSGQRQGADTGVVIDKRQKAGRTALTSFFDNYRESKIELGKVLLPFIQHYVSVGRQIRIIGEENKAEYVVMTPAMQLGRYDIFVDEGESGVNERFEALFVLQTTLPQLAKAGVPITPEFIDLLPLPPHLRKSWRRQIAWEMTVANRLPPPGWNEGDPLPMAAPPPGLPVPA